MINRYDGAAFAETRRCKIAIWAAANLLPREWLLVIHSAVFRYGSGLKDKSYATEERVWAMREVYFVAAQAIHRQAQRRRCLRLSLIRR